MNIATDFYADLYTPYPVDVSVQEKLLDNVGHTSSSQQKDMLGAPLCARELQQAVYDLFLPYFSICM